MASSVERLQKWYASQCDGNWEHSYGVSIDTLDNPGWRVQVDLTDTELDHVAFETLQRGDSEEDSNWVVCRREGPKFVGVGGKADLEELLGVFVEWAEGHASQGKPEA